ncbi:dihydroorotate dehydrogenase [Paratissierella segnis]|jgi:dihydroorotate dehydrogenase (NAD+) catalytic subunit|uniref:Dihydroorotate dehydrogenase n=1 Tax=Paratissierella segnis TaxID=2763679 RepID=A0A926ET72_9FIRM|nr:dihydroorotate dehydrogenase [Paratissierella segnis]MBC8587211.1 dihydroorotate dehydrogenase [Paratissierella segnis]
MTKLNVNYSGVDFKNPVVLASGTCGFGTVLDDIFDIEKLGGLSSKGLTLNKRSGNEGIRIWETSSGIMNSVGLENPGIDGFISEYLSFINSKDLVNIVNLSGHSFDDYFQGIEKLNDQKLDIIELNISCPNVKEGGMNFGIKTEVARQLVREVRRLCKHKLVIKLSPNAEDIVDLARMCEEEGADGISLVNTFLAMAIDIYRKKPIFDNGYAGLSGPAIKPIALRMVHQVSKAVQIPVMGLGGISTWQDAVEFLMAGARVIQVGTATFTNPKIALNIIDGLEKYLESQNLESVEDIIGIL